MLDWSDLFASTSAEPAQPLALDALPLGRGAPAGTGAPMGAGPTSAGLGWPALLSILPSLLGGKDAFGAFMHGYEQTHQLLGQQQASQQQLGIEAQRARTAEEAIREAAASRRETEATRRETERARVANQVASHEQAFVNRLLTEQPETREEYERIRNEFTPLLVGLGAPESYLAVTHPFQAPGYERRAQKLVKAFFANPANQALIQDHPEQLAGLTLPIDRDGTGHPTLVPLPQLAEAAGMPFGVDPESHDLILYPKGMGPEARADAEGYFRDLLAGAKAEGKLITPELRNMLRDQANRRATTVSAKVDPLAQALAQERLDKLKEENAPINVEDSLTRTLSGRAYVDVSRFQTAAAREKARKDATEKGYPTVSADEAQALQAADQAKLNMQSILDQLVPYLARDASGRILKGPENTLAKIFQRNPVLGAFPSWRTAAIQAVQAVSERRMGLRLNRGEIMLMYQNDIPQISDTYQTAIQRVDNFHTLLGNKEAAILVRDRTTIQRPLGRLLSVTPPRQP